VEHQQIVHAQIAGHRVIKETLRQRPFQKKKETLQDHKAITPPEQIQATTTLGGKTLKKKIPTKNQDPNDHPTKVPEDVRQRISRSAKHGEPKVHHN